MTSINRIPILIILKVCSLPIPEHPDIQRDLNTAPVLGSTYYEKGRLRPLTAGRGYTQLRTNSATNTPIAAPTGPTEPPDMLGTQTSLIPSTLNKSRALDVDSQYDSRRQITKDTGQDIPVNKSTPAHVESMIETLNSDQLGNPILVPSKPHSNTSLVVQSPASISRWSIDPQPQGS